MSQPSYQDYQLFELDEMLERVMSPHPLITRLVGPIRREVAEKSVMPYWIKMNCHIMKWQRSNFEELVDVGGES